MKRYVDRVQKALNLSEEEFDNFLTLLKSDNRDFLTLALSMMRGQANATAQEMKAMFAHYVLTPIFEDKKSIRETVGFYQNLFDDEEVPKVNYASLKAWVSLQLYYIKSFVRCSPALLQQRLTIFAVPFNNVWAKDQDIDEELVQPCFNLSCCLNELYGNTCMYY